MAITKENKNGSIRINDEAVAEIAGDAASGVYGVVGLAPKSLLADQINELLKKGDYKKGVYVRKLPKKGYEIDIYVYMAYGVKMTEVLGEIQKRVKYVLEKTFGITFTHINVYVQDVKVIE